MSQIYSNYPPSLDESPPAFMYEETQPLASVPINIDAEQATLGSILIDQDQFYVVASFVTAQDYAREAHRWLFDVFKELLERGSKIDFVTVVDLLERKGHLKEMGGPAFVTDLISRTPTAMYAEHYAQIVWEDSARRKMIEAGGKIAQLAYDRTKPIQEVIASADRTLTGIGQRDTGNTISLRKSIELAVERIDFLSVNPGTMLGIPTGFTMLDQMMGGLNRSDLIIIAGRPGMGKTTFSMNIALEAAKKFDIRVGVFSLEMSQEHLTQKLLAAETGIDLTRLRNGRLERDEWPLVIEAANTLAKAPFWIDDTPSASVSFVRSKARQMAREEGLDLLLIDYMQLMTGDTGRSNNREQELSYISRSLKGLARELNIPVVALSQLSRAVESRSDKHPLLSDLRECVVGETLLIDAASGRQVEIRNVQPGSTILGMGKDQKIHPYRVNDVWSTGIKPVFKMTTQTGRSIASSSNHPYLTAEGWKRLEELKSGDIIATSMNQRVSGGIQGRADLCRLLGYLAGNGSMQKHRCIAFCGSDEQHVRDINNIVSAHFPAVVWRQNKRTDNYIDGRFACVYENGYGKPNGNPLILWLKEIGALGHLDSDKFVPDFVFEAGTEGAKEFIAGYFATDGCVKKINSRWAAHFDTTSHQLAVEVQSLLLRLGIVASIGKGCFNSKSTKPIWRINIAQYADNLRKFAALIKPPGKKGILLQKILADLPLSKTSCGMFGLPVRVSSIMSKKIEENQSVAVAAGLQWRDQKKRPHRDNCLKVARGLADPELAMWGNSDLLWEKIISIEYVGEQETYDINTECSTFIGNGIVAHNSGAIEQDADQVLFLYRDDYYNPESERQNITDVDLAKHRLGATGRICLYFRKEIGQFRDLEIQRTELDY